MYCIESPYLGSRAGKTRLVARISSSESEECLFLLPWCNMEESRLEIFGLLFLQQCRCSILRFFLFLILLWLLLAPSPSSGSLCEDSSLECVLVVGIAPYLELLSMHKLFSSSVVGAFFFFKGNSIVSWFNWGGKEKKEREKRKKEERDTVLINIYIIRVKKNISCAL